ncbi:MAG: flagellin [Chloroflexi bacterium]|nr:flagellin [Chloroflexota bacterium]
MSTDVTRIAGNIGALNALNSLQYINNQLAVHQTRLATGKRLNESADDPAGFNLATTFDVRRQGLKTVLSSIGDAKNVLSTAEGGLKKIQDILVKMQNKVLEAKSDTIGSSQRDAIQAQLDAYVSEIDDIVSQTEWNGTGLIGGSASVASLGFLTDPSGTRTTWTTAGYSATVLSVNALDVTGTSGAAANISTALTNVSNAIDTVKDGIADVGAFGARLTFKEEALTVQYTNTEAAFNRIMNANMAEEQVEASKFLILQQTATAMLSQANMAPQFLLSLFR